MKNGFPWLWLLIGVTHLGYSLVAVHVDPFLRRDPLHGDANHFDTIAWSLATGGPFELDLHRAPLFPVFVAGIYKLVGRQPDVIRVLNGLLMTLGAAFMAPLVKRRFGDRVLWWFLLLYALHPLMVHISGWVYTEPLMIALMGALAWAFFAARQRGYPLWGLIGIGALLGLISLTRSNGIYFSAVLAVWLAIDRGLRRGWYAFPITLLVVALIIAPWTYRNWVRWDRFIPVSLGGKHLWASNNDVTDGRVLEEDSDLPNGVIDGRQVKLGEVMSGKNEAERDGIYTKIAVEWIRSNPERFVSLIPRKLYYTLTPISYSPKTERTTPTPVAARAIGDLLMGVFLLASAAGTVRWWRKTWRDTVPLWLMAATLFASAIVFNGSSRYILPIAPAMCLGVACLIRLRDRDELDAA